MIQVADNIYQLGSVYHNFYLLTDGGKATVIDAGCSKELGKLDAGLAALNLDRAAVEAIIMTHAHADHIGFANDAQAQGTEVRAHEREAPIATGAEEGHAVKIPELPLLRPGTWRFLIGLVRVGVMKAPRLASVETFADDEVLDLPGRPRVVYTPGHTVGHAAFYLSDSKILFCGDALVTRDLFSKATGPQMLPDVFHTDPAQARESLDVLAGLDTELVLPGHGNPHRGSIAEAVAAARA